MNPKEFSDTFMENYNKNMAEFDKEARGLYIVSVKRRYLPILKR